MHGIIFGELKKMVDLKFGGDSWSDVLKLAELPGKIYMPVSEYPDSEARTLMFAVAKKIGMAPAAFLEEFGEFIVPDLIALYRQMIKPEWRTLDVVENTEETIHRVVRRQNPGARPPALHTHREGNELLITYASPRQMCGIAIGIVRGLARYYDETVAVEELSCMAKGAGACRILVRGPT